MKQKTKQLLLLMCIIFPLTLSAQSILSGNYNLPRPGDRLIKQQVVFKSPGDSGKSVKWDFSELKVINENYELRYDTLHSNLWVGREHRTMYYYSLQGDTFQLCGHENPTSLFTYRKPEIHLVFPFPYGRAVSSYFDATGQYCSRMNIRIAGKTTVRADASGEILLPGGDTLRHVMRVHLHKSLLEYTLPGYRPEELNDSLCPVMSSDSIDYHLSNDSVVWRIDTWKWYAEGYRYPVFETVQGNIYINKEIRKSFASSFYYPPNEQYYALEQDNENQSKRDCLENKYTNRYNDRILPRSANGYEDEVISYRYSIDSLGNLEIVYISTETTDLLFTLFDLQGRQLSSTRRQSAGGQSGRESISLQTAPRGEYLLQIICNGKLYGEKILKQ